MIPAGRRGVRGVALRSRTAAFLLGVLVTALVSGRIPARRLAADDPASPIPATHMRSHSAQTTGSALPTADAQQQQQQQQPLPPSPAPPSPSPTQQRLRGAPLVFLSFSNAAYLEFLLNWQHSVAQLEVPHLVAALDDETAAACQERGIPHHSLSMGSMGSSSFFRENFAEFRRMGSLKVAFVLWLLEEHSVDTVVVSDTDTVWLRDPSEYFQRHPAADWLISTDCVSHKVEVEWRALHWNRRCGHVAGNFWGRAYNTGVFAVRNCPAALRVLRAWRDLLQDPARTSAMYGPNLINTTDQGAFNVIVDQGMGAAEAVPEDPRTVWAANHTLRLHALPAALFAGGHVAFVQRIPEALGVAPYVVHTTFQRRNTLEDKRSRLREYGVWYLDGPEYYREGQYLQYDNDVRLYIAELEQRRHGGSMAPLYKHVVAASYQLALFRDSLAIARLTNRTVALPQSWCWCDYDHTPDVLRSCRLVEADAMPLPFPCPTDFILNMPPLEAEPALRYRVPGFLNHPQVPDRIRRSRLAVHVVPSRPPTPAEPQELVGHAAEVWPGIRAGELLRALAPLAGAAVLEIRGMQPGLFGGFETQEENAALDAEYQRVAGDAAWCCAGVRMDMSRLAFPYQLPPPLQAGWQQWQPPVMQPPDWCDDVTEENRVFVAYANHPCQFLTNDTAAAIAGRIS